MEQLKLFLETTIFKWRNIAAENRSHQPQVSSLRSQLEWWNPAEAGWNDGVEENETQTINSALIFIF